MGMIGLDVKQLIDAEFEPAEVVPGGAQEEEINSPDYRRSSAGSEFANLKHVNRDHDHIYTVTRVGLKDL